jgi:hypothetical protein
MNSKQEKFAAELIQKHGTTIRRPDMMRLAEKHDINPSFLTVNKIGRGMYDISQFATGNVQVFCDAAPTVTDEEILASQRRKFRTLDRMAHGTIQGQVRSMIVSGPAGIGKTYTIEGTLESAADEEKIKYTAVRGFVKATGLYKLLWENREANQVILLDDADSAFADEISLNLLKAALDTSKKRVLSWRSEKSFESESGDQIPNEFEYKGSVIFITNLNFDAMIAGNSKMAPHFAALISRSYYIDLNLGSPREYLIRIKDVLENTDMAYTLGLNKQQTADLMKVFEVHYRRFRELSLRMVQKVAKIMLFSKTEEDFMDVVETTCFKSR